MRLIDADALSKDLEKRWNVNDDQDFCNKEVWHALEDAPTIEPNGDLISREMALAEFRDGRDVYDIMESIEELPSAPDSRQRGEWLWDSGDGEYFCSECRTAQGNSTTEIISGEWKFCPNCGADMRGEEE